MNIFNNKKMIFFDMGNTLLDFHQGQSDDEKDDLGIEAVSKYLETIDIKLSSIEIKKRFLEPLYSQFHLRVSQLIEIDVDPYLNNLGTLTTLQKNQVLQAFYSEYRRTVVVNEGALELLKHLKNASFKIGVISNCFLPAFLYKEIFVDKGLDDYIDDYTFSYTYGIRKPNPRIFEIALTKNHLKPNESLMIGDGLKPDIKGSRQLGIQSVWYNNKNKINHDHIEMLLEINKFEELIKFI